MSGYPYDEDHLQRTAALLYDLIPEYYKRRDRAADADRPPELRAVVEALAAPLAAVRQSIEELYGDLFVDSAGDDMLPTLAAEIALDIVFRDAEANRRDLRTAMARRRRKGTPAMLEEMARALLDRQVATREGWKAVQVAQDLDIPRLERTTPDLRRASVAERAAGPLATLARAVDPRPSTDRSGHAHPRHMIHWAFPTRLQPLRRAACTALPPGPADLRFAFDAAGAWLPLRVRSTGIDDRPGTDRVPEGLFAEAPGAWHGLEGRFTVRTTGLPAASARPAVPIARSALRVPAHPTIARLPVDMELIETDGLRTTGPVEVELFAAPRAGNLPDTTALASRGRITLDATGITATAAGVGVLPADPIILLVLRPDVAGASRILGETVLSIASRSREALRASTDAALAAIGHLRGAVHVRLPEMLVEAERWLYLAADGSLHDAAEPGSATPDRPLAGNRLPDRSVVAGPVGPIWPESEESAERTPFTPPLPAPAAAPAPVHGLTVLRETGLSEVPAGETSALVFVLTYFADERRHAPALRLVWTGPDPRAATWEALGHDAQPIAAGDLAARFERVAELLAEGRRDLALAFRFESERDGAVLSPGEIAFTAVDGRAVLIHVPELVASEDPGVTAAEVPALPPGVSSLPEWPLGPAPLARVSGAAEVGADGSAWRIGTTRLLRRSVGQAVPLLGPAALRCRLPAWRRLCPWMNEVPPAQMLDPTPPGRLDIDPRFGLFAIAATDAPVPHPAGPTGAPPPVTVDIEAGATMEIGALPIDHGRLLNRAPRTPTRLVSASGHLGRATDPDNLGLPLHRTLSEAFAAIDAGGETHEVVRIVDSARYAGEVLTWPASPETLIVEVAAGERSVVEVLSSDDAPGAGYDRLELVGLALVSPAPLVTLPPAQAVELTFVSVWSPDLVLRPVLREAAGMERLTIRRSALGAVRLEEEGRIEVADSILDGGSGTTALTAVLAHLLMDRATVSGAIEVEEVDISDAILSGPVVARERFKGCIRFSLLAPGGATPRKHRIIRIGDGTEPPFLSRSRRDPAYLRLDQGGDARILTGASDGGEMGAFNAARLGELMVGLSHRLAEHTPAGLRTGLVPRH